MCTSVIAFGIFWNRRDPELALLKHFKRCFAVINILINIVYFWTLVRGSILGGWSQSTKMFCLKTFLPHTLSWGQHLFSFFFQLMSETRFCSSTDLTEVSLKPTCFLIQHNNQASNCLKYSLHFFFFFDIPSQTNDVMPQHYSFFFFFFWTNVQESQSCRFSRVTLQCSTCCHTKLHHLL